ncbi:MAG TPA: hypothetical protein VG013_09665, partial [Gemmataceae bacterium]|nr:hypothetical protein [Gemmataceae bacterium]
MRNFLSLPSTWARCLVVLAIPCLVLALGEYLVGGRPAQGAAKPPPEEEEEAPAKKPTPHGPAKKPLKEVEDTAKPPRHKGPLRVPEQESTDTEPADEVEKPESPGPNSLARAAQKATDPEVKELFRQLSHPYDMVYLHRGFYKAVPIAQYIGSTPDFKGNISIRRYREQSEPGPAFDISARALSEVKSFEEIAVDAVDGFLKKGLPREGVDGRQAHPSLEKLDAAEKALGAVLSFHQSAVERGRRTGSGWKAVGKQLRGKL